MNEISGIYRLNGASVDPEQVQHMLDAVASWPADRIGLHHDASVSLGARQFFTTSEDTLEALPLQMGPCLLTADARIDNRQQLIRELSLDFAETDPSITNGTLILHAYEKWGEDSPDHLIGDFTFAIWDNRISRLFCARDAMGVRPFYYCYIPGNFFAFGTTIGMVLPGCDGVDTGLNEFKLGQMMARNYSDRETTIRKNILRLPGGHCLSVGQGHISIRRYWRLEAVPAIRFESDAEYAASMREVFMEAVRVRLRSIHPIGAQLSGGLDSSSVVCAASRLLRAGPSDGPNRLHAFSAIFPQSAEVSKAIDERGYQQAVAGNCLNVIHHPIICDGLDPFVPDLWQGDQPITFYNYFLDHALFAAAEGVGVRVMLTGHDGDAAVSHGFEHLAELAARLRWIKLFRQSFLLTQKSWKRSLKLAWNEGFKPYLDTLRTMWSARRYDPSQFERANPLIKRDFAHRIGLSEAMHATTSQSFRFRVMAYARANYVMSVTHGIYAFVLEDLDWLARARRIEVRHPFFDRRFIEFSMAIPSGQKLRGGVTRYVMHEAMRGILPDEVYLRRDKSNLSAAVRLSLRRQSGALREEMMQGPSRAFDYLDSNHCQAIADRINTSPDYADRDAMDLFFAVLLRRWLLTKNKVLDSQMGPICLDEAHFCKRERPLHNQNSSGKEVISNARRQA